MAFCVSFFLPRFLLEWLADFWGPREKDYQQLTRKMVVDQFKEDEAEKNALTPVGSRASVQSALVGRGRGQEDVSVSA